MDTAIESKFEKMGARVKMTVIPSPSQVRPSRRWSSVVGFANVLAPVSVDIRRDGNGEYFDVRHRRDVDVEVLDVKPADRHLLLMAREPGASPSQAPQKSKFLCGHDERSWFVAAIPESARARDVQSAKDALKPAEVWEAIRSLGLPMDQRDRRRTAAFIRQGEWFFIPRPRLTVNQKLVIRNEPIRRGAGKPHMCQFLYRNGGQQVHVSARYPNGLTNEEFGKLDPKERDRKDWRVMMRDAHVYVKGAIRHPDHKTVWLSFWHEVVMNTETKARAMRHVAFLD